MERSGVVQPIVIDNGSGVIKAGFAGEKLPKCCFANYIGRPKYDKVFPGVLEGEVFIGPKAEEFRGIFKCKYPMEHGIVTDWDDMEKIWHYVYGIEQLNAFPEEHPVLLTEAPLNPKRNREKTAEIFFETFNVPALYVSMQAVLSLFSTGKTTGVVLDSGDGVTHAVPIFEGRAIQNSITRIDIAGRDVTNYLQSLLRRDAFLFKTTAEFEIVKSIKEQICFLTNDPLQEKDFENYILPDGATINIGSARCEAPEVLFKPNLIGEECKGIHEVLVFSIQKSDIDLRKVLYQNIFLSGGSTLFKGFSDKLNSEIKELAPDYVKINMTAPEERLFSTWIGGSVLASLGTFENMWVLKTEYNEEGPRAIYKRTF